MTLNFGNRVAWVQQSEIRNMTIECEDLGGLNLAQGVCDLEVPPAVIQGAKQAMDEGYNTYTRYNGLEELRKAIALRQQDFSGLEVDPETEVVVSVGATGALYAALLALLSPGDEVILFEPYYGYHPINLVSAGAVPVYVRMQPPDWDFSPEDLERAVTPRTKAILVLSDISRTPEDSGKVYSLVCRRDQPRFLRLLAVCLRHSFGPMEC